MGTPISEQCGAEWLWDVGMVPPVFHVCAQSPGHSDEHICACGQTMPQEKTEARIGRTD